MMGQALTRYHSVAHSRLGPAGPVKLAMKTRLSAEMAARELDTPDRIRSFREALRDLGMNLPAEV